MLVSGISRQCSAKLRASVCDLFIGWRFVKDCVFDENLIIFESFPKKLQEIKKNKKKTLECYADHCIGECLQN